MAVRRLVALVLIHALAVSSALAWSAHVHEYVGHDHPEHHHGIALHTHAESHSVLAETHDHESEALAEGPTVSAEPCDPGRHVVSVTLACTSAPQVHVDLAAIPGPTTFAQPHVARLARTALDVRTHGPPAVAGLPSRAPPSSHLA